MNISDLSPAKKQRVIDAICGLIGYNNIMGIPNKPTREEYAQSWINDYEANILSVKAKLKEMIINWESEQAKQAKIDENSNLII